MFFVLVYSNHNVNAKRFKTWRFYLPKSIINNYNVIINGTNFYNQRIDSNIKRYEEIRNLATGQGNIYTTGCLLDYEYVKNYYRLIAIDLSRQKEVDANLKAIQQIEFEQLKNADDQIVDDEIMFLLTIYDFRKNQRKRSKFSQATVTVL